MVPTPTSPACEAHKTEPDKNTYLVFKDGLQGADAGYDYGRHFLFQGHEGGAGGAGYITRINLDADAAHRVTLLATKDATGASLATIDGSTWDPWAQRLLFTTENTGAPTYSATPDYPSTVVDVSGALGRGGYEGVQDDSDGNIWIVEDVGGSNKPGTTSKRPNSFVYRYVPAKPGDLENGKLQALQVLNEAGAPITFESQLPVNSPDQVALHTYGKTFKLTQPDPSASTGTLTLLYKSDKAHSGLDNVAFLSPNQITFGEDAGDGLHGQRNALDSAFVFDVTTDYSNPANQPIRWLAEGRDASATIDAANGGFAKNDGDNEITGLHVSDGDPSTNGILGARIPNLNDKQWRWF